MNSEDATLERDAAIDFDTLVEGLDFAARTRVFDEIAKAIVGELHCWIAERGPVPWRGHIPHLVDFPRAKDFARAITGSFSTEMRDATCRALQPIAQGDTQFEIVVGRELARTAFTYALVLGVPPVASALANL